MPTRSRGRKPNGSSWFTWLAGAALTLPMGIATAQGDTLDSEPYLESAQRFAQAVLEHGRDVYGDEHTPLFVDGLHVEDLEPVRWGHEEGEWVLSNFASHQPLMRLLDGLTELTGEDRYREAAEAAAAHALADAQGPSGLLWWGRHATYDLESNSGVYGNTHELKSAQPYYELMWRVDPERTRRLLEAIWGGHVVDWAKLDFDRHANIRHSGDPQWDHDFIQDLEVPFETVRPGVLSFANFGMSLMHAGAMLGKLDDHEDARTWTHRLALRWDQARHPETGLGGGQISHLPLEPEDDRTGDRAYAALGHVHPEISEANMIASYLRNLRYGHMALAQLQMGEQLLQGTASDRQLGGQLITWAADALKAYGGHAWIPQEQVFLSVVTDGEPIQWDDVAHGYFGVRADSLRSAEADGQILWAFSTAYRLTGDTEHWHMVRELMPALGLGDPGEPGEQPPSLTSDFREPDWTSLYAMLELYEATGERELLRQAARIGDNIRAVQTPTALFPREGREWARTGDEMPLALLHLAATIEGRREALPAAVVDFNGFHARYYGKPGRHAGDSRTYDYLLYYDHSVPGRPEW